MEYLQFPYIIFFFAAVFVNCFIPLIILATIVYLIVRHNANKPKVIPSPIQIKNQSTNEPTSGSSSVIDWSDKQIANDYQGMMAEDEGNWRTMQEVYNDRDERERENERERDRYE